MQPDFIYFDFGNILFRFCHERMLRQMAAVAAVELEAMRSAVFDGTIGEEYDRGEVSPERFYDEVCGRLKVRPEFAALEEACSDIFDPIPETLELARNMLARGIRCGVLSNTNHSHWTFANRRFPGALPPFTILALSYELGLIKPQPAIYQRAAELANVEPQKILFFDDRPENIAGARDAGWDAVLIEDPARIRPELVARGLVATS